jgi:hypothetical protein
MDWRPVLDQECKIDIIAAYFDVLKQKNKEIRLKINFFFYKISLRLRGFEVRSGDLKFKLKSGIFCF